MESIYNATLHGTAASQHNNLTSSSLKPQRTIIQSLALKAAYQGKRKEKPNTNQTSKHLHQPIRWDAFQTRRYLMVATSIS